jgi:uncharacterized protein (TIGR03067 family)
MKGFTSIASAFLFAILAMPSRAGDGPTAQAVQRELQLLQGAWDQVAAEYGKKKITFPEGKQVQLTIHGDRYSRAAGGQVLSEGTVHVYPGKTPKAIDLIEAGKPGESRSGPGIYEVKGDELRMCVAVPGRPRPTTFAADEGARQAIITFRRVKTKD